MKPRHLFAVLLAALLPVAMVSPAAAAGSVTATPVADVYVSSASPTSSGNGNVLQVDDNAVRVSYVKFNVQGIPVGVPITGVQLRVNGVQAQTAQVVDAHAVGNSWTESTTYNTRPTLGAKLASATVAQNQTTVFNLPASAVKGNGTVSVALARTTVGGLSIMASSEYATVGLRPQLVVTYGDTTPPPDPDPDPEPPTALPYGPDSFFQSDTAGLPVDAGLTTSFRNFMASPAGQPTVNWPKVNLNPGWSGHNHIGQASDPIWRLAVGSGGGNSRLDIVETQGVHLSDAIWNSVPTGTQDRLLVVRDPIFGYTVQCADVVPNKAARTWTASNCGIFWHSSNGLDYRNPQSDDQRNMTSRGRIPDAMQIPRSELDAAVAAGTGVGHVLHIFFVETDSAAGHVHPMVGDEGGNSGWGAEGVRIGIDPSIDLVARGLTGHALALARTLQQNGGYIGDNAGVNTQIKVGPPADYTGTNLATDVFKGKITWNDFVVYQPGSQ